MMTTSMMMMMMKEVVKLESFEKCRHSFPGNPTLLDKIHSILTYICTYLWGITFILLMFLIYVLIRGPLNIINSFHTGKNFHNQFIY
jgi:hypothetical protein